nr:Rrf2 family transcriptional regulator [uncultured Fluviicola sp.]
MFSKTCEYGIKATLYVAHQSQLGIRTSLKEISKAIDSPEAFTAKILQLLSKNGILKSTKGPSGGFEIEKENREAIKLSDLVFAIDGNELYQGCGLGLKECNSLKPCPLHDKFMKIREDLKQMLETTTIEELANGLNSGLSFLKR